MSSTNSCSSKNTHNEATAITCTNAAASRPPATKEGPLSSPRISPSQKQGEVYETNHVNQPVIANTHIFIPRRTIGGIRDQVFKSKRCNCKRSGCLKLYCECLNVGILCNETCSCTECQNVDQPTSVGTDSKDLRAAAIQALLERNQGAFRPKASGIVASLQGNTAMQKMASTDTTQTNPPLVESRSKKSSGGCNCRKSQCLKKYCECFQAQLYCTDICRCENCHNKIGDVQRESLMKQMRKKEEERESVGLAKFTTSSVREKGKRKVSDKMAVPTVKDIGGVPASTVATVSATIAASGVDLFLPVSTYATVIEDKNGNPVNEIAFGRVGKQTIGGETRVDHANAGIETDSKDAAFAKTQHDDTLRDVDHYRSAFLTHLRSIGSNLASSNKAASSSLLKKRSHEEFAKETIPSCVLDELKDLKMKMDSIDNLSMSRNDSDFGGSSSNGPEDDKTRIDSRCDSKSDESISYLRTTISKDIVLYKSLSQAIRERAQRLASIRKSKEKEVCGKNDNN